MEHVKILIAEENIIAAEDIKTKLNNMGYQNVEITTSGEEAIVTGESKTSDITENALSQELPVENDVKYRSILDSMPDAIYTCSEDLTLEYMNPKMIKKIGYYAVGEKCYTAIHGVDEKCSWCEGFRVQDGTSWESDVLSSKDGRPYQVSQSPIYNTDGTVSKLNVYRAMTDDKEVENRPGQTQKMETIGKPAGGIAHDFNNILSSIIGFTELALYDVEKGTGIEDNLKEVHTAGKRARALVKQILASARQSESIPTGTERILFVDDEPSLAKSGSLILKSLGYKVTYRTSGKGALELVKTNANDFDLVITDMTMPYITGENLSAELMKIRPDIPVILCTGHSKKISDEIAVDIGIKAFAYKPIAKADLAKTVRKVLDEAKTLSHE